MRSPSESTTMSSGPRPARRFGCVCLRGSPRLEGWKVAQRLKRPLGFALLIESYPHHDEHKPEQKKRFLKVTEKQVDDAGRKQKQKHRLPNDFPGDGPDAARFRRGKLVRPCVLNRSAAPASERPQIFLTSASLKCRS